MKMFKLGIMTLLIASCQSARPSSLADDQPAPVPSPIPPQTPGAADPTDVWTCTGTPEQALNFSIRPWIEAKYRGFLTGGITLRFVCEKVPAEPAVADGNFGRVIWSCRAGASQAGATNVTLSGIKTSDGKLAAHVHRIAENTDTLISCVDREAAPPASAPTYASVKSIIDAKCVSCHSADGSGQTPYLDSLEQIKARRPAIQQMIETGRMPYQQPTWRASEPGKKVLEWLKYGAEFQPHSN